MFSLRHNHLFCMAIIVLQVHVELCHGAKLMDNGKQNQKVAFHLVNWSGSTKHSRARGVGQIIRKNDDKTYSVAVPPKYVGHIGKRIEVDISEFPHAKGKKCFIFRGDELRTTK